MARGRSRPIMSGMRISHLTEEAQRMRRVVTIAVITCSLLAATPWPAPAQPSSLTERAALAQALLGAWLPLERSHR